LLRGKFIIIKAYIIKQGSQINKLTLQLRKLEKEQTKAKACKSKEGSLEQSKHNNE
jgi:hypothetical protein